MVQKTTLTILTLCKGYVFKIPKFNLARFDFRLKPFFVFDPPQNMLFAFKLVQNDPNHLATNDKVKFNSLIHTIVLLTFFREILPRSISLPMCENE